MTQDPTEQPTEQPIEDLVLEIGPVAHGGHFVARHEGQVVFVRHALPGERVRAVVTEAPSKKGGRFLRADAVEVLVPSPERVVAPCPYAHPDGCGGCDFQHVALDEQRRLKAAVVREQLQRLAGLDVDVVCEAVPGDEQGLRWRTRMQYVALPGDDGEVRRGLRKHRSHEVVPIDDCRIAHPDAREVFVVDRGSEPARDDLDTPGPAGRALDQRGKGRALDQRGKGRALDQREARALDQRGKGRTLDRRVQAETVTETVRGREFTVAADGFWQVHPGAPETLVGAVLQMLKPRPGESALDLYSGVGLFTRFLAEAVGGSGRVIGVEGSRAATAHAEQNLHDLRQASVLADQVDRWLRGRGRSAMRHADLVVLDPPRVGAKRAVVEEIAARGPRAVAYVACDPAALARDIAYFAEVGYTLRDLRCLDLFPMTQHIECVALLETSGSEL